MSKDSHKQEDYLKKYMKYLWSSQPSQNIEYEVRFGTKGYYRITKTDFDNVVKYLKSIGGFVFYAESHTLKMNAEYFDKRSQTNRFSNIRTEILGVTNIQDFCKTNSLVNTNGKLKNGIQFLQKLPYRVENDSGVSSIVKPGDYNDFNFRVSLQEEKTLPVGDGLVKQLLNDWNDKKKLYRLVTRTRISNENLPGVYIDLSTVKTSKKNERYKMVPTYNIKDSNIFNEDEHYEIEIEFDVNTGRVSSNELQAYNQIRFAITNILRGLQQTNFPVSYTEIDNIKQKYMKLIHKNSSEESFRVYPKHFIGPSSISLELKNIAPIDEDTNIPNIRSPYTVTEKADGIRKLLYIDNSGKIYLIDTNMNVQYTGAITKSVAHNNTLIDGEHILTDKVGNYINTYAAFDIYFLNEDDKRANGFIPDNSESDPTNFRYPLLQKFVNSLPLEFASGAKDIAIQVKNFYYSSGSETTASIFSYCNQILKQEKEGYFPYEIDGLIFTPAHTGVGMTTVGETPVNVKKTWSASFKWKPPHYNTVDFLVSTRKNPNGEDVLSSVYEEGVNMQTTSQTNQYKTLILRVGFDESKHGYINPCNDVYNNNVPKFSDSEDPANYKPMQFFPTNPSDNNAGVCNIMTHYDFGTSKNLMYTEDGEVFDNDTIVEFKYDVSQPQFWRWKPIRVRHDKTSEYRRGLKNYGNAYHVANSVWSSIHHPVTEQMISTGAEIPELEVDDDVYYNRSGSTNTRALRDFHNLYVKRKLITSVSERGNTLIDLAVGKGGDFSKWIAAKLKFVFGVDISSDNINNRLDGACARYLNYRKKYKTMPNALFVVGNSGLPLRTGEALSTERGKEITNAVFGIGAKDKTKLGEGVYNQYGVASEGFNVVSCQFAFHYFFESSEILHNFLRNVTDSCALGGYFIGTCYDGKSIFRMLETKSQGESVMSYVNERKMWEIKKMYDSVEFNDDESSLGYAIDVYQESINKTFREYLVNFDYVVRLMKNYGFELITDDESRTMGLPSPTGKFNELFNSMKEEIKREKRSRRKTKLETEIGTALDLELSEEQKQVSFLNRYFVFKKVNNVDSTVMIPTGIEELADEEEKQETEILSKVVEKVVVNEEVKKPKKTKKKLTLKPKLKLKLKPKDDA